MNTQATTDHVRFLERKIYRLAEYEDVVRRFIKRGCSETDEIAMKRELIKIERQINASLHEMNVLDPVMLRNRPDLNAAARRGHIKIKPVRFISITEVTPLKENYV